MNHPIYRALVTYSNNATGEIRIKIPSLLGAGSEVSISYIGRTSNGGVWSVPNAGSQIVVTADDTNLTNIFWLQTDVIPPPSPLDMPTITVSGSAPANDTVGSNGDIWIVV